MSELVVGMGEVGSALVEVLGCDGRDLEPHGGEYEVLHIAFPYTPGFVSAVQGYAFGHEASLVVVHSTVPVGTCDPQGWVHSPVRGRHPHLAEALRVFPKTFGGARALEVDWPGLALYLPRAAETEAAKLWELAQFGLQVRVTQAIHEWCESKGVDPSYVYRAAALDYNEGYSKLGEERFMRPVLDYVPGEIGGHCVTPSMAYLDHPIARMVEDGM